MSWLIVLVASIAGVTIGMALCAVLAMSSHESSLARAAAARGAFRTIATRRSRPARGALPRLSGRVLRMHDRLSLR